MSQPKTRQELYDRIRESSRDEVILEEMIRLGFWPRGGELPDDPAAEIRKRTQLQQEISAMQSELSRLHNIDAMIREAKKRRIIESRQRQKETKQRRERERQERAEAWKRRKEREILYLGEDVSRGLNAKHGDDKRLGENGLPVLSCAEDIAQAMKLSIATLRFLAYNRKVSTVSSYIRFEIPKKSGGMRSISAPMPALKQAQEWVLRQILQKIEVHEAAHGFHVGRSIVSNARPHVGSDVIINIDLKDFFPSISYPRVKGLFRSFGYANAAATTLALLCTEADTEQVEVDGQTYYVALGERKLPQGAPSSPAITNLTCRRMDRALSTVATKLGFRYTRYADDLSFSKSGCHNEDVGKLLRRTRYVIQREGFTINDSKTKVVRKSRRQEVTGIIVNDQLGIDRRKLKAFRATLFQLEKDGPTGKKWGHSDNILEAIHGYANYVAMVDPDKGRKLVARVKAIVDAHGWSPQSRPPPSILRRPMRIPGQGQPESVRTESADQRSAHSEQKPEHPAAPEPSQSEAGSASDDRAHRTDGPKKKPWWRFW